MFSPDCDCTLATTAGIDYVRQCVRAVQTRTARLSVQWPMTTQIPTQCWLASLLWGKAGAIILVQVHCTCSMTLKSCACTVRYVLHFRSMCIIMLYNVHSSVSDKLLCYTYVCDHIGWPCHQKNCMAQ